MIPKKKPQSSFKEWQLIILHFVFLMIFFLYWLRYIFVVVEPLMNVPSLWCQNEGIACEHFSKWNMLVNDLWLLQVLSHTIYVHDEQLQWPITSPRFSSGTVIVTSIIGSRIASLCSLSSFFKVQRMAILKGSFRWVDIVVAIVKLGFNVNHWVTSKNTVSHRFYQTKPHRMNSRGTTPTTIYVFSIWRSFTFFVRVNSIHTSELTFTARLTFEESTCLSRSARCFTVR